MGFEEQWEENLLGKIWVYLTPLCWAEQSFFEELEQCLLQFLLP